MRISDWSSDVCSSDLGRTSVISRKAVDSGVSSGGFLSQARATICSEPKRTGWSSGASKVETRAVILSRPCSTAMSPGMAAAGPAVSRPTPKKRESTGIADRTLLVLLVARLPGARAVGVHQRVDQGGQHSPALHPVAPPQDAVPP